MPDVKPLNGFPSIDKPWLKYYSDEAINAPLPECTMYQYIWENNKDYLNDVALRYYGTKVTYRKLFERIKQAATAFYAMGVRAGDFITIMSLHTPETIYCLYALNYLGAVANMVYMTLSENEIVETLNKTESKMLIVLDVALDSISRIENKINVPVIVLGVSESMPSGMKVLYRFKVKSKPHSFICFRSFLQKGVGGCPAPISSVHDKPAIIIYTSGTTGEPKGVELSNDNINAIAWQYGFVDVSINRGDTILVFMPPFLSIGICYLHMPMCKGVELIICANPDPKSVTDAFVKLKPNHFVTAPSNALMIIERDIKDCRFLKSFGGGGEALSLQNERRINAFLEKGHSKIRYSAGYGMSEFSAIVTLNSDGAYKEGTIGIPLPKCNIKVLDPDSRKELSYNQVGELFFNTPSQMRSYLKDDAATQQIMESIENKKWIRTGDLGFVDEDGFVHYTGRLKRIYMTRVGTGENGTLIKVFPQRIEECIEQMETVKICGVIMREDRDRLHIPVAFVVLNGDYEDKNIAVEQILAQAKKELPAHDQPSSVHILNSMPMTLSGKIDYRALEAIETRP